VTRGQLPQTAGSLGLNGGGAAAAVPPVHLVAVSESVDNTRYRSEICRPIRLAINTQKTNTPQMLWSEYFKRLQQVIFCSQWKVQANKIRP